MTGSSGVRAAMRWDVLFLRRSKAAWFALATLVLATALAVGSGWDLRARWAAELAQTQALERASREKVRAEIAAGDRWASMPLLLRSQISLPPPPLVELATGRADLDPREAQVSAFDYASSLFRDYQTASPVALASGRYDLGFVMVYLLPLVVIALGYGLLAEERARRLDRLLAVHGARSWQLALGRVTVRAAVVAVPLVAAMLVIFVGGELTSERAWRCAVACLAILGYAACWWALVLVVASLRLDEGSSLFALLTAWVVVVLIAPALVGALARAVHPPPSRFTLIATSRAAEVAAMARAKELLGAYSHDHPELDSKAQAAPPAWARRAFVTGAEINRAEQPIMEAFALALQAQRELLARWQLASPALVVHRALTASAGTDELRALAFRDQAGAFSRQWREAVGRPGMRGAVADASFVNALPSFRFVERPFEAGIGSIWPQLVMLWGLALAGALIASRRLRYT
jgi:ABC-2 type transport system permease protein